MKLLHLIFFAILTLPLISYSQCNGILTVSSTPSIVVCGESPAIITASLSNGNSGWSFKIYKDSSSILVLISNIDSATVYLDTFGLVKYYVTADSSGCSQKR